jgi:predicted RNA-binding protein with PIN domain
MDAATLQPIQAIAERICSITDVDAAVAILVAQGKTPILAGIQLKDICRYGGQADRIAATLDDPDAARRYVQKIAATFAPFADILRAVEVTGDGERWISDKNGYTKVTTAEAKRHKQAERKREAERKRREERQRARAIATYKEAAAAIGIPLAIAHNYAHQGKLVAVYLDGKKKAAGVTRASLDAYVERQEMRKAAATANAARKEAERAEREANADTYWTEDGRKIDGADRITARQIADEFSVSKKSVEKASRRGMIAKVYNTESRKHAVGYLRESAETWARAYKANVAAGGIYYTAAGQIVETERISRREAAAALHLKEQSVRELANARKIERAYADAACTIPCGYTRRSVEAYAQAHPRHIPARRAEAIANFKIQIIPPPPRRHDLRAAQLDPDTESAQGEATPCVIEDAGRHRRREPRIIIFRLATFETPRPSEPQQERQKDMDTQRQENATPQKLEVAKAYTIHADGVIRAICVSEADRDEIVAALELYRKAKAAPGEVESALKLLRAARDLLDVPADTAATADEAQADEPKAAQADENR